MNYYELGDLMGFWSVFIFFFQILGVFQSTHCVHSVFIVAEKKKKEK